MLAALLPGSTAPASAQPDDRPCIEAPTAACLTRAAVAAFAEVDDPAVWRHEVSTQPTVYRLLVETGQAALLPGYLDDLRGADADSLPNAVGSAAAALVELGDVLAAEALILENSRSFSDAQISLTAVRSRLVMHGDPAGVAWTNRVARSVEETFELSETALARRDRDSPAIPHYGNTVAAAAFSAGLRQVRNSQCDWATGRDPGLAAAVYLSNVRPDPDVDLAARLGACTDNVWPMSAAALYLINLHLVPVELSSAQLLADVRYAIHSGRADEAPSGIPEHWRALGQAGLLTLVEPQRRADTARRWLTTLNVEDHRAEAHLVALWNALEARKRTELRSVLEKAGRIMGRQERNDAAALLVSYAATMRDAGALEEIFVAWLGPTAWDRIYAGIPFLRSHSTRFRVCEEGEAELLLKRSGVRLLASVGGGDEAVALARIAFCDDALPVILYEISIFGEMPMLRDNALRLANEIESPSGRAVALADIARLEARLALGRKSGPEDTE